MSEGVAPQDIFDLLEQVKKMHGIKSAVIIPNRGDDPDFVTLKVTLKHTLRFGTPATLLSTVTYYDYTATMSVIGDRILKFALFKHRPPGRKIEINFINETRILKSPARATYIPRKDDSPKTP